jgi:hypothetical protein
MKKMKKKQLLFVCQLLHYIGYDSVQLYVVFAQAHQSDILMSHIAAAVAGKRRREPP